MREKAIQYGVMELVRQQLDEATPAGPEEPEAGYGDIAEELSRLRAALQDMECCLGTLQAGKRPDPLHRAQLNLLEANAVKAASAAVQTAALSRDHRQRDRQGTGAPKKSV